MNRCACAAARGEGYVLAGAVCGPGRLRRVARYLWARAAGRARSCRSARVAVAAARAARAAVACASAGVPWTGPTFFLSRRLLALEHNSMTSEI